jgi:transcriptional regulator with XRE-family HTH domain
MKTLGQRIRELREEKDLSLREVAKRLQVSAAFLSDVELGRRYPSPRVLSDLAEALGTSVDDLRTYDMRPLIEDIKRLTTSDPSYGLAFRKVVDKAASRRMSPEDLMNLIERKSSKKKL